MINKKRFSLLEVIKHN